MQVGVLVVEKVLEVQWFIHFPLKQLIKLHCVTFLRLSRLVGIPFRQPRLSENSRVLTDQAGRECHGYAFRFVGPVEISTGKNRYIAIPSVRTIHHLHRRRTTCTGELPFSIPSFLHLPPRFSSWLGTEARSPRRGLTHGKPLD